MLTQKEGYLFIGVLFISISSSISEPAGGRNSLSPSSTNTVETEKQYLEIPFRQTDQSARFFFWVSPAVNYQTFLYAVSFLLIPAAVVWVYWLYPPGKYYSTIPASPDYIGYQVMNDTGRRRSIGQLSEIYRASVIPLE
jgi:hypothetical protein